MCGCEFGTHTGSHAVRNRLPNNENVFVLIYEHCEIVLSGSKNL